MKRQSRGAPKTTAGDARVSMIHLSQASRSKKRGRPSKGERDLVGKGRSYWLSEVYIDQGWAWATELVEVELVEGKRRWAAFPLCLGWEGDIVPILKGKKAVPNGVDPGRRRLPLEEVTIDTVLGWRDKGLPFYRIGKRVWFEQHEMAEFSKAQLKGEVAHESDQSRRIPFEPRAEGKPGGAGSRSNDWF